MKKTVVALVTGLALVAGQAAAAGQNAGFARLGDRVGAKADASSEFAGIPVIGLLAIAGVIAAAVVVVSDDASESD